MKGYFNNPGATQDALRDGWLYTGDLGYVDEDGFLHIQGRKKSIIVTPSGKKIHPEEVEAEVLQSPYILECLVWGDATNNPGQEVEIQAIVVPNLECFINRGVAQNGDLSNAIVEEILRREVKMRCRNLAPFKRITRLTIRHEEFEKTTTKKVKRYLYTGTQAVVSEGKPSRVQA